MHAPTIGPTPSTTDSEGIAALSATPWSTLTQKMARSTLSKLRSSRVKVAVQSASSILPTKGGSSFAADMPNQNASSASDNPPTNSDSLSIDVPAIFLGLPSVPQNLKAADDAAGAVTGDANDIDQDNIIQAIKEDAMHGSEHEDDSNLEDVDVDQATRMYTSDAHMCHD